VREEDLSGLKEFLKLRNQSSSFSNINAKDSEGLTALHEATDKGLLDFMSILIENGASVNETDPWGDTPLHFACVLDRLDAIDILLIAGADVRKRNADGDTAFDCTQSQQARLLLTKYMT
jgi:ankyrin repeat protein